MSFYRTQTLSLILLLTTLPCAFAQEFSLRKEKPDNVFFYHQWNLHGGYHLNDSKRRWQLADDVGAKTQATFEWYGKDQKTDQIGYTKLIRPKSWNVKFGIETDPEKTDKDTINAKVRLYGTGIKLHTKWDRTFLWLANKSIPYGHNPALDPHFGFLPNQSSEDIGISRDPGLFLQTPVNKDIDFSFALTLGKGDPYIKFDREKGEPHYFDYDGTWLLTSRLGSPSFKTSELGVTALAGKIHEGDLRLWRLGADWVYKFAEKAKMVHQLSGGKNRFQVQDVTVYNLLNNFEWFFASQWTLGMTHVLRHESPEHGDIHREGKLYATLSYALNRQTRLRLNTFTEYEDTLGDTDKSVLLQLCYGCGLVK